MLLKKYRTKKRLVNYLKNKKNTKILFIFGLFCVFLCIFNIIFAGIFYNIYKKGGVNLVKVVLNSNIKIIPNYLKSLTIKTDSLRLDISHEDYQKLLKIRKKALDASYLLVASDDYVPATLYVNNEPISVEIRLKGDNRDHWEHQYKWSFRVQVKEDKSVFGMKKFSLQTPQTRNFVNEWVFHEFLNFNNLLRLRYKFIDLSINGKNGGIYALEEHFDKRLLESQAYKEGPIVRFEIDSFWRIFTNREVGFGATTVDAFGSSQYDPGIPENFERFAQFNNAKNVLEAFRTGKIKTHEAFDVEKLAKIFAMADLMGQYHILVTENIRFYYNPVTAKLEPIGYDNQLIEPAQGLIGMKRLFQNENVSYNWINMVFSDPVFYKEYIKQLRTFTNEQLLDRFFASIDDDLQKNISLIHKSYPYYKFEDKKILYNNQKFIKNTLDADEGIVAYTKDNINFTVGNIENLPVEVKGLELDGKVVYFVEEDQHVLSGYSKEKLLKTIDFSAESYIENTNFQEVYVLYSVYGDKKVKKSTVRYWSLLDSEFFERDVLRINDNTSEFLFVEKNEEIKEFYIKNGNWDLDRLLVFPEDYTVIIEEGTTINMKSGAHIISRSSIKVRGTDNNKVKFIGEEGSFGLSVISAGTTSTINYAYFTGLSAPKIGDWSLTGAVAFYESPVEINNSKFEKNKNGDDIINIIRSPFTFFTSEINDTVADAIDIDFSKGEIKDLKLANIGIEDNNGDGIDFSLSEVLISDVSIFKAGDKAISVGENSNVKIYNSFIESSNIGIASKDLSKVYIKNVNIKNGKLGLVAYQKKSEYGPAEIFSDSIFIEGITEQDYDIEEGSVLILNGEKIKGVENNLSEKY